jgi:hypothetical protein
MTLGLYSLTRLRQDEIAQFRSELDDLLWDFDDYVEADTFDAEKFEELQKASRKAAPKIVDILKRMKLSAPVYMPVSAPPSAPASVAAGASVSRPASEPASIVLEPPLTISKAAEGVQQETGELVVMGAQAGPDLGVDGTPELRPISQAAASDLDRSNSHRSEVSDGLLDPPPRPPSADPWQVGNPPPMSPLPLSPNKLPKEAKPIERRSPVPTGDSPTLPAAYPVISTTSPHQEIRNLDGWMRGEEDRRNHAVSPTSGGMVQNDPLLAYWRNRSPSTSAAGPNSRSRAGSLNQPPAVDRTRQGPTAFGGNDPPRYSGQSTDSAPSSSSRQSRPPSNNSPIFGKPSPTIPENLAVNNHTHKNGYTGIVNFPPRQASLGQGHPQPVRQPSTDSFNSSIFDCVAYDGSTSPVASTQRTSSVLSSAAPGSPYSPSAQLPQYSAHPPIYQNGAMSPVVSSSTTIGNHSSATLTPITTINARSHNFHEGSAAPEAMAPATSPVTSPVASPFPRVDDPGLIPVESEHPEGHQMPARQPDCSIGPNSSFYQMKGFCKGAEEALRGDLGFKKVRRPMGVGHLYRKLLVVPR